MILLGEGEEKKISHIFHLKRVDEINMLNNNNNKKMASVSEKAY